MAKNNRSGQAKLFTDSDFYKIRKQLRSKRHKLLFDILRFTGERIGAVVQLRWSDVGVDTITFRASTRKASPSGKRITRQVPIHPTLMETLESISDRSGYLFPCRLNPVKHITVQGAAFVLGLAIKKAKVGGGYSTHSFRRSLITKLNEYGTDLRTIQEVTGHQDLRSLQRYIEVSPDRVRKAIAIL